jgi:SdrD B-like domain
MSHSLNSKILSVFSLAISASLLITALNFPNTKVQAFFHPDAQPQGTLSCGAPITIKEEPQGTKPDLSSVTKQFTIESTVYLDTNKDGLQGVDEYGFSDITVVLYVNTETGPYPLMTTTTNANGVYTFADVPAGTSNYNIVVPNFNTEIKNIPAYATTQFHTTSKYPSYINSDYLDTVMYNGGAVQWVNVQSESFPIEGAFEYDFGLAPCTTEQSSSSSSSSSISSSVSSVSSESSISSSSQSSASSLSSSSSVSSFASVLAYSDPGSSASSYAKVLAATGLSSQSLYGLSFLFAGLAVYSFSFRRRYTR